LYYRFGFAWSPGEPVAAFPVSLDLIQVRKIFGNSLSPLSSSYAIPFRQFIEALLERQRPPDELWDLTPMPPDHFKPYVPFKGHIQYRNSFTIIQDKDKIYYVLFPAEKCLPRWYLVTQHAAAVLESLRRGHTGCLEAATYFLERGIPFSTREVAIPDDDCVADHSSTSSLSNLPNSISKDASLYASVDLRNYIEYEGRLRQFLQHPHARAAFLQGGLIWRLVQASNSQVVFSLETILIGPVSESKAKHAFTDPQGGKVYWDNTLTEAETELICGLHEVSAGIW
jgi:hypothetical protein